jgi:hypothetical protein
MTWLIALLLTLTAPAADGGDKQAKKPAPPARVTVTAELACLHCTFGEGEGCAVCLKIDAKTPLLLAGKAAKELEDMRLTKKVVVASGTLAVDKDKRLVLTSDDGRLWTEKDKDKAPPKGQVRVEGRPVCGMCDLMVCDECTLAVANATSPVVLDGKLAREHSEGARAITVIGRPFVDQRGLLRVYATKVDLEKAK